MESERILLFLRCGGLCLFGIRGGVGGKCGIFGLMIWEKESASGRAGLQSDVGAIPAGPDKLRI